MFYVCYLLDMHIAHFNENYTINAGIIEELQFKTLLYKIQKMFQGNKFYQAIKKFGV